MTKKQDFLRSEQNRDANPDKMMKGSEAEQAAKAARAGAKGDPADHQAGGTGKVANDHNQTGESEPTQIHEGQRTPQSRSDRQNHIGSTNQAIARQGGVSGGPPRNTKD